MYAKFGGEVSDMSKDRSTNRGARLSLALVVALTALLTLAVWPAAAYSVVSDTGNHGPYSWTDTTDSPPVTCIYGEPQPPFATAYLHYVKVRPPSALAMDRTGERDHQKISWQFKVQGEVFGTGDNWMTFAQSNVQSARGYDDAPAGFSPVKIAYNSRSNPDPQKEDFVFRTMVIVKWYKANGSVGGKVKLLPTYYRIKGPFSPPFTGGGDYCGAINTAG
jgi:hypothetical protein